MRARRDATAPKKTHVVKHRSTVDRQLILETTAVSVNTKRNDYVSYAVVSSSSQQYVCASNKWAPTVTKYAKMSEKRLRGLSPRANYTDRAAAAGRRS
jgi:hypothetical protein